MPGAKHGRDEQHGHEDAAIGACEEYTELVSRAKKGNLANFRNIMKKEKNSRQRHPDDRSLGGRYVMQCTENGVKNAEDWVENAEC